MLTAFNRFTSRSGFGRRAARDAAVWGLRNHHGWAPGLPFTLAELGGLPQATVNPEDMCACLGVRAICYRALEGGKPVAIVTIPRTANPSGTISGVAQRLGLTVEIARTERVWLAVWRWRGQG